MCSYRLKSHLKKKLCLKYLKINFKIKFEKSNFGFCFGLLVQSNGALRMYGMVRSTWFEESRHLIYSSH
jgi:tellurite resistance protein TehA-like permease